jgi:signal transduction histidine kinase
VLGIATTAAWFVAFIHEHPDLYRHETAADSIWNILIRLVLYVAIVEVLALLQDVERRLQLAVRQRTTELQAEVIERQRAEASLRKLGAQLSAAEDAERRRVAYDIHDALSQMLGLVKLNLETVVAETAIDTRQYSRLSDVVKMVGDLIRQTRDLTFDLHPAMLDHFGLVPTLQRFGEDFGRHTSAEVSVNELGSAAALPIALASYLFRAIKEIVNNSVKHGNAKQIVVTFHWNRDQLRIVTDDDGCGFDTTKATAPQARNGLGLAGIHERLNSLGGSLSLESQPGGGTRVMMEIPLDGQQT